MNAQPFYQVDVFSANAYGGNPVAVIVVESADARARLTAERMQHFASWTHLSETTFILPVDADDEADYELRIFTPTMEIPFAGHPTLGSCRAWLAHGGKPKRDGVVVQRCGAGLINIRIGGADGQLLSFAAPPLRRSGKVEDSVIKQACAAMSLPVSDVLHAEWIENGPRWVALFLKDAQAVLNVKLSDPVAAGDVEWGVVGPFDDGKGPDGARYEVRTFAPCDDVLEDPVCGSFTAGLAKYLQAQREPHSTSKLNFVVSQGKALNRTGRLHVQEADDGTLWVGGRTLVCISGSVIV